MHDGPVVVARGEGEPHSIGQMTLLVGRAEWTAGAYNVMDQIAAPRLMSAVHSHAQEDQVAFVLEGTMSCWVAGREVEVAAGGYVLRPAGIPHAMWNAGETPIRFLEITSPGTSFEEYVRRLGALIDSSEANADSVGVLARDFGITFFPAETEELSTRLGLPVGGFWKQAGER
jgi:mannose-6-phosphate isomerase-like protein (cupin superfamily)